MVKQQTDAVLVFQVDGRKYEVRMSDLTGRDVRDFRTEVGFPPQQVFTNQSLFDLDVVAGFVWLTRRKTNPRFTYDQALDAITYDNFDVDVIGGDEAEDDGPEA